MLGCNLVYYDFAGLFILWAFLSVPGAANWGLVYARSGIGNDGGSFANAEFFRAEGNQYIMTDHYNTLS